MTVNSIHVARIQLMNVNPLTGAVVDKNSQNTAIRDFTESQIQQVIIPDQNISNSAGNPTVDAYLKLEAASGYVVVHLDQTYCITYNQHDLNNA